MENKTGYFFSIVTLVLIVLKIIGAISWSWLWVLAPFWGSIFFTLIILFIAAPLTQIRKD